VSKKLFRYGALPDQTIELTVGNDDAASRPLIVLLHGGFWKPHYDRTHMQPLAAALGVAGWSVADIEYRRIPGEPDATLIDVTSAYAALQLAVVPNDGRVILVGFSAGGHLALWLAATLKDDCLCGAVGLAPVADLALAQELGLGDGAVKLFLGAQLSRRATLDPCRLRAPDCAVSLLHGEGDEAVPLSVSESYAKAHPRTRLVRVLAAGHMALIDPGATAWLLLQAELKRM
jgi:acetyl esterase/lipase